MVDFLAGEAELEIYRGDTFSQSIEFFEDEAETVPLEIPVDGTWRAHVRALEASPGLSGAFTIDASLGGSGRITISMPAATTATLPAEGFWDLEHADVAGNVRTYLRGPVTVIQDVTR